MNPSRHGDSRPVIFLGLHLGLGRDPAGLCMVERQDRELTDHGDQRTLEGRTIRLGKAWLVPRLKVLLQSDQLHLPRSPEAKALAQELLDYEVKVQPDANERYGAFRVGSHDELVTALGLAVQVEPRRSGWEMIGLGD